MARPLLYELPVRPWLARLSAAAGREIRLTDVPDAALDRWTRLGVTHLWLMGVWPIGPRARAVALAGPDQRRAYDEALPGWRAEEVCGSPYAIQDYQVDARFGGDRGLACLRGRLRARGIRLILDFVPNHVGLDHPWVTTRPEFLIRSVDARGGTFTVDDGMGGGWLAHGRDPYFPPWIDTAQIEYRSAAARAAMGGILAGVAARCDGVRCDMAMLLLNEVFDRTWTDFPPPAGVDLPQGEFWEEAIRETKRAQPGFEFIAEAYWGKEGRLRELGFDFAYDKELTDKLVAREAAAAVAHLRRAGAAGLARGVRFLENHDECRAAARLGAEEHRAAAFLLLGLPGLPLFHDGQFEGARVRTPIQLARQPAEPVDLALRDWYERAPGAVRKSSVGRGSALLPAPIPVGGEPPDEVVLVEWLEEGGAFAVVAVNLAAGARRCRVPLRSPPAMAWPGRLPDLLGSGEDWVIPPGGGPGGPLLELPPHAARLYQYGQPGGG